MVAQLAVGRREGGGVGQRDGGGQLDLGRALGLGLWLGLGLGLGDRGGQLDLSKARLSRVSSRLDLCGPLPASPGLEI